MRRPRSRAGPASRTTSSATVATRAWRSCASCGARPGRTVLPHPLPVPPVAAAWRSGDADRALGRERTARRAELYRAGLGRGRRASSTNRKAARRCRRASWRGGSRPMASRCHSRTSAACRTPCTTCCRRSPRCCTAGSAGIRWNGSRCCARPANAPGNGVPWAATCRWTSLRCFRTCLCSSTRSPTTSHRSGCRTSWSARWPSCWRRTTTRWPWRSTTRRAASVR